MKKYFKLSFIGIVVIGLLNSVEGYSVRDDLSNGTRMVRGVDLISAQFRAFIEIRSWDKQAVKYLDTIQKLLLHKEPDNLLKEKLFRIYGLKAISCLPISTGQDLIKLAIDELVNMDEREQEYGKEIIPIKKAIADALGNFSFINNEYEKKILDILSEFAKDEDVDLRKVTALSLGERAKILSRQGSSLYQDALKNLFRLFADEDNEVRTSAIEAIGNLEIDDEIITKELKKMATRDFSRWLAFFHVRPSQIKEAKLVAEATIALLKIEPVNINEEEFEKIMKRFYSLGDNVLDELYKNSGINYVNFKNRVNNLKEVSIIFYRLLNIIDASKEYIPNYSYHISSLGAQLSKMQSGLEEIFESGSGATLEDDELSLIAAEGMVATERIIDLDKLLKLCEVKFGPIAVPAIHLLAEFGKYYPQGEQRIFSKLNEYLKRELSPIRTVAAKGLSEMILIYFPEYANSF